jgi:ABC-2 type transport system permease protein
MDRLWLTLFQSILSPVVSTSLYFIVFGSVIGRMVPLVDGVSYGSFIVPGLLMLTLLTQSLSNISFGIYMPKFSGSIYEILAAPISSLEIVIGFVGASATKSLIVGSIILITASFFAEIRIDHPVVMVLLLVLTCVTFSLFGFLIGILSENFEQLQVIPLIVVTPLVFLGGSLYSIEMLPEFWQQVSYFNPVVYLINGMRWAFYGVSDINIWISIFTMLSFLIICITAAIFILTKGYRIKS